MIPNILIPPYCGPRKLLLILRLIDAENLSEIKYGMAEKGDPGIISQYFIEFTHEFNEKGYLDTAQDREKASSIVIKIGMAIAMSDNKLDENEGQVLKNWILKKIGSYSESKKVELKEQYNSAMKNSYNEALDNNLSLGELIDNLNDIDFKSINYEAIELCYEILSVSPTSREEKIHIINQVVDGLGLDLKEIEKIRDKVIVRNSLYLSGNENIEDIFGIDLNWTNEKINRYLRNEFKKWNNRLNTLKDDAERDNAQRMLDIIAKARKKYA